MEQEEFQPWKPYVDDSGKRRLSDNWRNRLYLVGKHLHQLLISDPQRNAIDDCLKSVGNIDNIHFRFVTDNVTFPDVPFEAIWDRHRMKFLRDMAPMARQILLRPSEATVHPAGALGMASAPSPSTRHTGPLLVIQSNTGSGTLGVKGHTFDRAETRSFSRLPDLDEELTQIKAARTQRQLPPPVTCRLETGDDCASKLEEAVGKGPWDIVHFCGHSVKADDQEVFIVLPGRQAGKFVGMAMGRFAQILARSGVKLLILSSCEGASSLGVFRAAQEGIPTIIGFRWEVETGEATQFANKLHQGFAAGAPLGRAYLDALHKLTDSSPAFLSAMLVVQHDHWAEPVVKVEG